MNFRLIKTSKKSQARLGLLKTPHGAIPTPFFMPIATRGTVKSLTSEDLKKLGADIVLSNTYHLYLRPGLAVIKKFGSPRFASLATKRAGEAGGLHRLMNWPGPILTDSGGFQAFSLDNKNRTNNQHHQLVKVTDKGVEFRSVYDGSKHLFTPKKVLAIQEAIGSDIRMVLDVCSPSKCSREQAQKDLEITLRWAKQTQNSKLKIESKLEIKNSQPKAGRPLAEKFLLFGIVQGALYRDLRLKCAQELVKMNFHGYAIGGLAVGESPQEMYKVLDYTVPALPQDKPRYLMGVGYPEQIVESVKRGIDMFDCVIPTREARHGRLYQWNDSSLRQSLKGSNFYHTINIRSEKFARDISPINPASQLPELKGYSKAYLRHLFAVSEPLSLRLATLNNLEFYLELMKKIRQEIKIGAI